MDEKTKKTRTTGFSESKIPAKYLKPYDSQATEDRIYAIWEKSGLFNPDNCVKAGAISKSAKPFTIIMPPTNANGSLHAGHGLVMTIEDIMTRYKRMRGYKTLWLPGLDHAGFETQVVYEKKLEKEGRTRFGIEPKQLYKEIMDFTLTNSANIKSQVRKMGASCDWSREKFTLDSDIVQTVYRTFKKLSDDQLLYRGKRIVSWCPRHQTSFSDLEIKDEERVEEFYYLKYGPFIISTSRPETKFGDKYVVMHPDDKRYAEYKDGQKFDLEWINGPITATVVKDEAIDMAFGTGVMTITPWHDPVDFAIADRHHLDKEQIINEQGKLMAIAGEFAGLHIKKARPLIIEKLKSKSLVEKIDPNYKHVVRTCYKCGTIVEPQIKSQWFVKMKPLAEKAIEVAAKRFDTQVAPDVTAADPKAAAPGIFAGAFMNAGQVCIAIKRLYVHESIYDEMCGELAKLADEAVVGDGLKQGTQIGPLQNAMQYEKVKAYLESARSDGTIIAGGQVPDGPGYFNRPTIDRDIQEGSRLVDEEQFGPILPVIKYSDPRDAIARANGTCYGLGGSVWSTDLDRAYDLAVQMEAGTVWVNKHLEFGPGIPFGGAKQSGLGVEFAEEGLAEYTQIRVLNIAR